MKPLRTFAPSIVRQRCFCFEGILRFFRTGTADVNTLHGDMAGAFRLRLGDYRVLFTLEDNSMRIFGVRHRSEAYRQKRRKQGTRPSTPSLRSFANARSRII